MLDNLEPSIKAACKNTQNLMTRTFRPENASIAGMPQSDQQPLDLSHQKTPSQQPIFSQAMSQCSVPLAQTREASNGWCWCLKWLVLVVVVGVMVHIFVVFVCGLFFLSFNTHEFILH